MISAGAKLMGIEQALAERPEVSEGSFRKGLET